MNNKAGIGSFFHQVNADDLVDFNLNEFIPKFKLFYTGRHAIKFIIDEIKLTKDISKIWLPNYYCQHVTSWLKKCYSNIYFYEIDPFSNAENLDLNTFSNPRDIVILNNFWGIYNYNIPTSKAKAIFIEDHSHGWQSTNCLNSNADYCVASLRKTLPIPLGGILWQPNSNKNYKNNLIEDFDFYENWRKIKLAMHLKSDFIRNKNDDKSKFLDLINQSEQYLHKQYSPIKLSKENEELILRFLNKDYQIYKKDNLKFLLKNLKLNKKFKVLNSKIDCTFGLQLVFKNREDFNEVKKTLITKDIYPSELWPNNKERDDLSYLLNIHIDFRYNLKHMQHITTTINTIP
ncbi:hypothetical protein [Cellulophaga omnivescoria]|uniref:hypothetical protein n=1 Tax=Cellulophaga omnivescoria TaxID=1888890 RepID=UPI0009875F68|nr:hypothetical protein [Cellulophaga omnivescoria]WBU88798.1 hypothetical protein PBN93_13095 [Cellulophaga omnivescoria]